MQTLIVDYQQSEDKKKFLKENKGNLGYFDTVIFVNNHSVQGAQVTVIEGK
jgi:hypothetical protein